MRTLADEGSQSMSCLDPLVEMRRRSDGYAGTCLCRVGLGVLSLGVMNAFWLRIGYCVTSSSREYLLALSGK